MEMKISFPGGLRVDAGFDGFTVSTDQPESSGGDGSAPAPFDLFLASLGTCAGIYMLAFMKQRGIDPEGSGVTLTTEADTAKGMVGRISLELRLPEGFPGKYEQAVVRAVEQCTVKRHIQDPPAFAVSTTRPLPG
jgi:ribosomal protein S12 methylthiotransferase accessory factor